MAFDLNKNDGADKATSNKPQSTSKFDLSKGDAAPPVTSPPAPSSNKWILVLLGVLIIGGGIWFYLSKDEKAKVENNLVAEVPTGSSSKVVPATVRTAQPSAVESDTGSQTTPIITQRDAEKNVSNEAASLNNKTVASFAEGSSAISQMDQSLVKRIVSYLTKNPDAAINVLGYASSDGSLQVNQIVSQGRADAFKDLLVKKEIAGSRISAIGKGIENPIASNATNAGRKKNRRIEITFQ
ncbi:OmpA family protein [Pedobacter hartonius]|uniref:OmpA family protein n=1 Tax=Pedobacter hartonius TaxID=425514 RepID=A0A1H4HFV4_9SPHI|nr:OmpA family protein [Pedobacter hartonius]SEB20694.1 OmpA family protein [Pedobacter hartonius]